jgi:hypothetical protein
VLTTLAEDSGDQDGPWHLLGNMALGDVVPWTTDIIFGVIATEGIRGLVAEGGSVLWRKLTLC